MMSRSAVLAVLFALFAVCAYAQQPLISFPVNVPAQDGSMTTDHFSLFAGQDPLRQVNVFGDRHGLDQDARLNMFNYLVNTYSDVIKSELFRIPVGVTDTTGAVVNVDLIFLEGSTVQSVVHDLNASVSLTPQSVAALTQHLNKVFQEKTILRLSVGLPNGTTDDLVLIEGNVPAREVNRFIKKHNLPTDVAPNLLQSVMNEVQRVMTARQAAPKA